MKKTYIILLLVFAMLLCACASAGKELKDKNLKGKDGSLLTIGKDSGFIWRLDPVTFEDPQYHGSYKIYQAKPAVSYIVENFAGYGLTEEEIDEKLSERNCDIDAFYCIVFTNKEYLVDGVNTLEQEEEIFYYGFFYKSLGQLDLINIYTGEAKDFTILNY